MALACSSHAVDLWNVISCFSFAFLNRLMKLNPLHSLGFFFFFKEILWFDRSQQPSISQLLAHSLHVVMGERLGRIKVRAPTGWDKDRLTSQITARHASQVKQGTRWPLPWAGRCSAIHRNSGLHHTAVTQECKQHHSNILPCLPLPCFM